jgi:hypothetical protein
VAELETQVLDSKLEIDSLKASPVVSDEVDCADCSIFLADLALFKEKHASKCDVTPSFKEKTECIDHVCARIKLHTRLDIVNTKISATRIKSYYKP